MSAIIPNNILPYVHNYNNNNARARYNEITEKPIKTGERGFLSFTVVRGVSSVLAVPDDNGGFLPGCAILEEKKKDTAAGADRLSVVSSSREAWGRSPGLGVSFFVGLSSRCPAVSLSDPLQIVTA